MEGLIMRVNTNYNDGVVAPVKSSEAIINPVSTKNQDTSQQVQLNQDIVSFASSNAANAFNATKSGVINSPDEARNDLRMLNAEDNTQRNALVLKILAQANASADKYMQLLMQSLAH
jgi:hypothetical protein